MESHIGHALALNRQHTLSEPPLAFERFSTAHSSTHRQSDRSDILAHIAEFNDYGRPTLIERKQDIPYYTNQFWTSGQRCAHSLHEISYRACFKPQLPAFFIERLTKKGEHVYDPYMGRGTAPLQAALMERHALGNDCNPLSRLLVRPRFNPPSLQALHRRLQAIDWSQKPDCREDLLTFYHPDTLRQITILRNWLIQEAPHHESAPDSVTDWIRMVALNRLTGHSSGFLSVYSLPPNQAASLTSQRKINQRCKQTPPPRDIMSLIMKKSKSLLRHRPPVYDKAKPPILLVSDAAETPHILDSSVDLVVTSPPFLDIVNYASDNWLRCWFANIESDEVAISIHRKPEDWTAMVRRTLSELARVVKSGGHVAFEVGEVRRGTILLETLVWEAASGLPFERLGVMVNQQNFTKTANCWGVDNNRGGTNSNRIVLLKRR